MSLCSNCGNPVPEEAKFCPVCGTPVAPAPDAEPAAAPVVEAPAQEIPAQEVPAGSSQGLRRAGPEADQTVGPVPAVSGHRLRCGLSGRPCPDHFDPDRPCAQSRLYRRAAQRLPRQGRPLRAAVPALPEGRGRPQRRRCVLDGAVDDDSSSFTLTASRPTSC